MGRSNSRVILLRLSVYLFLPDEHELLYILKKFIYIVVLGEALTNAIYSLIVSCKEIF